MTKMISTMRQRYDGHTIAKNDVFDVKDKDMRLLKALGRVTKLKVGAMSAENTSALIPNPTRSDTAAHSHTNVSQPRVESEPVPADTPQVEEVVVEESKLVEPPPALESEPELYVSDTVNLDEFISSESEPETEMSTDNPPENTEYSKMLRDKATFLGIRVDGRWSDARVQREIDEYNKRTYQRMDMQAQGK